MAWASVMRRYRCTRLGWIWRPSLQLAPDSQLVTSRKLTHDSEYGDGVDAHLAALRHGARIGAGWTHAREATKPDARLLANHASRRVIERKIHDHGP